MKDRYDSNGQEKPSALVTHPPGTSERRPSTIVISDWLANCQVGQWTPFEAATALKDALTKAGYVIALRSQPSPALEGVMPKGMKPIYVKRWRTLIIVPESIASEVRDALSPSPAGEK